MPAYLQWRGQTLYEMYRPMSVQANKSYDLGQISKDDFIATLKTLSVQLEESVKCLLPEAEGTKACYQGKLAAKALTDIKEAIFFSDFL